MNHNQEQRNQSISTFVYRLEQLERGDIEKLRLPTIDFIVNEDPLERKHPGIPVFIRIVPPNIRNWEEQRFFLLATLFPWGRVDREQEGNLGSALRSVRNGDNEKYLDGLMERLLGCDYEMLPMLLREAIRYLDAQGRGLNWKKLLHDILRWEHELYWVQREWARSFFSDNKEKEQVDPES